MYMCSMEMEYPSIVRILIESECISDCDFEVYINRLHKFREDFKKGEGI